MASASGSYGKASRLTRRNEEGSAQRTPSAAAQRTAQARAQRDFNSRTAPAPF